MFQFDKNVEVDGAMYKQYVYDFAVVNGEFPVSVLNVQNYNVYGNSYFQRDYTYVVNDSLKQE